MKRASDFGLGNGTITIRKRGLDKSSTAAVSPLKKSAKESVKLGSADG